MTIDLSTRYLGFRLRSPFVASCSPLTGDLDALQRLDRAGVGAVVLPSLFEEQIEHDELEIERMLQTGSESFGEAAGFFPELHDYNTGPDHYLALLEQARALLSVPVLASLNGTSIGGWLRYAQLVESAGAHAIELNAYTVAADPMRSGPEIEAAVVELVRAVVAAVEIPVAVKLSPYWSSLANLALQLEGAGAAGLVLFNRFYQPDLDLETRQAVPRLVLSTSEDARLPIRWIGLLTGRIGCSLAASSGVHTSADAAKCLLVGADAVMMTSALLKNGPEFMAQMVAGLQQWMDDDDYESVEQLKGSAAQLTGPDPAAFERANYAQTLSRYSTSSQTEP
jgi:dihydroorotate dehydrogenase (fumarate)